MKIQRLNMDNSWCIEFAGATMLVDPWLKGVEVDFFPWFNTQWHRTKPIAISEVPNFDFVLITQKYPDHFHKATLLELNPKKLIVPKSIQKAVQHLLPSAEVINFDQSPQNVLGSNINVHFMPTSRKIDPIYDALLLENGEESILIASHGFTALEKWADFIQSKPPVTLAFSPFNKYQLPFFLGGTVSPGLAPVKKLLNIIKPQNIVATHDEDKHAKGIVHKFANITFSPKSEQLLTDHLFKNRLLTIDNYNVHTI